MKTNTIIQGDCLEIMKDMPDKSVDLILTDPPFNFESMGGGFYANNKSTKRNYLDSIRNLKDGCSFEPEPSLEALKKIMKKYYGYFFCNKTLVDRYIQFARNNGFNYDILVMAKLDPIPSFNNHHLPDLEYIILIREKSTYFSKNEEINHYKKYQIVSTRQNNIHPCQKTVDSMCKYIKVSTKENDIVLDPFIGSGTTAVACERLNRKWIGIEISPEYCKIARERIDRERSQLKMKL